MAFRTREMSADNRTRKHTGQKGRQRRRRVRSERRREAVEEAPQEASRQAVQERKVKPFNHDPFSPSSAEGARGTHSVLVRSLSRENGHDTLNSRLAAFEELDG